MTSSLQVVLALQLLTVHGAPLWLHPPGAVVVVAQGGAVLWATRCTVASIEVMECHVL